MGKNSHSALFRIVAINPSLKIETFELETLKLRIDFNKTASAIDIISEAQYFMSFF